MNNDLISRSALLEEIEGWHDSLGGTMNPADWGIQNVLQSVMDNIIEAEDVDAVEVVHGHYGFVGQGLQNVQVMFGTCSECHRRISMYTPTWFECNHFCPNCGAKMDGGADK